MSNPHSEAIEKFLSDERRRYEDSSMMYSKEQLTNALRRAIKFGQETGLRQALEEVSCGENHSGPFHSSTCRGVLVDRGQLTAAISDLIEKI